MGKQWVLITEPTSEVPEQGLELVAPTVTADEEGNVTISVAIDLSAYSTDYGLGRFSAKVERRYDDLAEPQELELMGNPPDDQRLTWRIITPDSMVLSIRNKAAGDWGTYYAMPFARFTSLQEQREHSRQLALVHSLDNIGQGVGLVRRGAFQNYACGDECGATFLEVRNGQPVPITYVCNTNRFGDVQLSSGDMIGEGDFTNQAIVGREFLIVSKQMNLPEGVPVWVVMGLLPFTNDQMTSELQQRLALSANLDVGTSGGSPAPTTGTTSDATAALSAFLGGEETFDLKQVQEQPEFPGGMEKMYEFMGKMQKYPDMEYEGGIQGKVYVQFTVAKDGSIEDTKVLRSVSDGLDKEAMRLVKAMPKWNPGKMDGKPVKCRFNMPIVFKLK